MRTFFVRNYLARISLLSMTHEKAKRLLMN